MARVITPSGDEVRTVYSSGGFAAGDYVFQTASGFEKASNPVSWPQKSNSAWAAGNAPIGLGFGFTSAADYLLGPSQTGGAYSGSAISFGDNRYTNTSMGLSSSSYTVTQLSNTNYLVAYGFSSGFQVRVYDSTFTTLLASFTNSSGLPSLYNFRLLPDNSGGCVVYGTNYGSGQLQVFYVANTSGNSYGITAVSSYGVYPYESFPLSSAPGVLSTDGVAYFGGRDSNSGSFWGFMAKYVYTPRSTAFGTSYSSTFNLGNSVGSTSMVVTRPYFNAINGFAYAIISFGSGAFYLLMDNNPPASRGAPSFGTSISFGSALSYLGVPTMYPGGNYGAIVFPMVSSNSIELQVMYLTNNAQINSPGEFKTSGITIASNAGTTVSSRESLGITTSSSVLSSNPDLTLYYARTNGSYQSPYARLITGALSSGVTPTSSAEVLLNSSTATTNTEGPIASFNPYSGLLEGVGTAANFTMQGSAAGSLSTPQPFVYGTSLTPAQTGVCAGVALTAASAGGTGKILVRGTAEVRSTLPNMPGALSFNHANYGTPGGIRGSVAGRTVTFEGIDG